MTVPECRLEPRHELEAEIDSPLSAVEGRAGEPHFPVRRHARRRHFNQPYIPIGGAVLLERLIIVLREVVLSVRGARKQERYGHIAEDGGRTPARAVSPLPRVSWSATAI